jgi:glutamate---cysteine ligase / carboxylate-amine ligase
VRDAFEEPAPTMRDTFDRPTVPERGEFTVGLEEELMLLDEETLDLAPRAPEAIEAMGGDPRFKLEMPAAQLEIVTGPRATVADAADELAHSRAALAAAGLRLAGAGAHPFASGIGPLNPGERYEAIGAEYASVARRQLVFGLHVHVAVRGADRALAVYNALRSHLPELAALAANAPFYEGRDSGLASVRSRISGLLPRQGVPPAFETFGAYEHALRWCGFDDPRQWWWELRLHPTLGTVEVRVPDTQRTVSETAALGAVVHALVTRLAGRHDAGERLPVADSWRIDQNRWSACRHGLDGEMLDLETGERQPTRERVAALLDDAGVAVPAGDGAARQREIAAERGLRGLVAWLTDGFTGV